MDIREKIVMALVTNLDYVYCNTCRNQDNNYKCEYCHRKSMNWQISYEAAESIADKILKEN